MRAPIEADGDQPDQYGHDESQHELLVRGRLAGLKGRPQALGEQGGIGPGKPQSAGGTEDGAGNQKHPCRRPMQRARDSEQQRAHCDDEDGVLQQELCDHARVPSPTA